jgi:hypothetical protein
MDPSEQPPINEKRDFRKGQVVEFKDAPSNAILERLKTTMSTKQYFVKTGPESAVEVFEHNGKYEIQPKRPLSMPTDREVRIVGFLNENQLT